METKSATLFDGKVSATQYDAVVSLTDRKYVFPVAIYRHTSQTGVTPGIVHINNRSFVSLERAEISDQDFCPIVDLVSRGFTVATFYTSDVDPDKADGYADGIRSFFSSGVPPTPTVAPQTPSAWRALSAWGWAASQILDHLDRDPRVDAQRVAVVGHSRGGKASLWAAAEDTRFAAVYSNQSGCGGAALSRRCYGERVKRITETFPHWFNETFATYAERENELPIDQHELISLLAPRHVFINSAAGDLWADPIGEYSSMMNAEPVFALLGQPGITDANVPPLDQTRIRGVMGYRVRTGKHSLTPADWDEFLKFADEVLQPVATFAGKPAGADSRRK